MLDIVGIKRLRGMGLTLQQIADELKLPFESIENVFLKNKDAWSRGAAFVERRKALGFKVYPARKEPDTIETKLRKRKVRRKFWDDPKNISRVRHEPPKTNKYKGVHRRYNGIKWEAVICLGPGKSKHLGLFETEDEAALAYNAAVDQYFNGDGYYNEVTIC